LTFLPIVEPFIEHANAAASNTPLLDALTQLEDLGVTLRSDGSSCWIPYRDLPKVPPDLQDVVHQCNHQLAKMLGKITPGSPMP
jgi:hypothetical protein